MPGVEGETGFNPLFGNEGERPGGAGAGVTSLNAETGALTLESTGGTVAITKPDGTHINLEVVSPASLASVNTGAPTLSALASAGFNAGALAWVETVGAYFRLKQSALTVDNITVVAASGKAGFQWVRINQYNKNWESQATWFIDPQNASGTASDENSGIDATHQLISYAEHARRWTNAQPAATAVTVSSNKNAVDDGIAYTCKGANAITFTGVLTNVVFSGTVTTFTNQGTTALADDIELKDATVPVSFTASGMLANAVLFKRTNGAARFWWACKDLGGAAPNATLRIGVVYTSGGGVSTLTNGDSYTASTLVTGPALSFPNMEPFSVTMTQLDLSGDTRSTIVPPSMRRTHCWAATLPNITHINAGISLVGIAGGILSVPGGAPFGSILTGIFRGSGTQQVQLSNGTFAVNGITFQGCGPIVISGGHFLWEGRISVHDMTALACVVAQEGGLIALETGGCLGGKGNTNKLINVGEASASVRTTGVLRVGVQNAFNTACTTDAAPMFIGNVGYTVAVYNSMIPVTGAMITSGYMLTGSANVTANGAQAVVIGATGPAAMVTPGAPTGWKTELINGAVAYVPYWT